MLRFLGASLAAAALILAAVAPAEAATSAQRFADAVERGKSAIRAKEPEFRAANDALDFERCDRVLEERPPPKRETERYALFVTAVAFGPMVHTSMPVLQQIVADLEAIPTRDPALRSGRAAWRTIIATWGLFPKIDRACEQLEAWAAAGWRASARPDFDFAGFARAVEEDSGATVDRKLERAARRLRRLGVSRGDARRFTGSTLFDDVEDALDGEVVQESSDEQPARISPAPDRRPR